MNVTLRLSPRRSSLAALWLVLTAVSCGGGGGGGGGSAGGSSGGGGGGPPAPPSPTVIELPNLLATSGGAAGAVDLRFTAPTPAATSYVVRWRVRHIETDADFAAATPIAHATTPGASGASETIHLTGLEPGRTLQFAVQVVRSGVASPFGFAVACRVPDAAFTVPPGAIAVSTGQTLAIAGATYVLTADVATPGTAFTIAAKDITLDLGGHTVTYGTAAGTVNGVYSEYLYNSGKTTVRNGTIVEGGGTGVGRHGVYFRGAHDVRLTHLTVTVRGPDANGITVVDSLTGDQRIDHCSVHCDTLVDSSRTYPGVAAIVVESASKSLEIDENRVFSSPQWGIKVQGTATVGDSLVHHNRVIGTKALVANGYMISVYKPATDVFENELSGESRGIHLDGTDGAAHGSTVHDNYVLCQDQTNPEYPDFHWVHGIKLEGARSVVITRNFVTGVADDAHAEVRCLDVDVASATGVRIEKNRFTARALTPKYRAHALQWTSGPAAAASDVVIKANVFTATDRLIDLAWGADHGGLLEGNAWIRDLTQGLAHPFLFQYFDTSDTTPAPGHRVLDAITTEDVAAVAQWNGPAPYSATREWSLLVAAVDGSGAPVAGASVTVRDASAALAFTGTTDAAGLCVGTVVATRIANGPVATSAGPFSVAVAKAGAGSYAGTVAVTKTTALRVNLTAGTAALDVTPPPVPTGLGARAISASRGHVQWSAVTDPSSIAGYLVYVDGVLVGITDETRWFLFGLAPATSYSVTVKALDRGGNASAPTFPVGVTTPAEDRGP